MSIGERLRTAADIVEGSAREADALAQAYEDLALELWNCQSALRTRVKPDPIRSVDVAPGALRNYLANEAIPGDHITLTGSYSGGTVKWTRSGTEEDPIVLIGGAIFRDPSLPDGPVLEITASHVILIGVEVARGSKVLRIRGCTDVSLWGCTIRESRDELVHVNGDSDDIDFYQCRFSDSGRGQPQYGELLYIGTHPSSVAAIDRTRNVLVEACVFFNATGAHIEAKEGTDEIYVSNSEFDLTGTPWDGGNSDADRGAIIAKGQTLIATDCTITVPEGMSAPHLVSALGSANKSAINEPVRAYFVHSLVHRLGEYAQFARPLATLPAGSNVMAWGTRVLED